MKGKNRPPRLYVGENGKRYIKLKGKKVYIKSKFNNKNLVRVVINNFQKRMKRKKKHGKLKGKPDQDKDQNKEVKTKDENQSSKSGSNLDLAKLLFYISANQKDKDDRERINRIQGEIQRRAVPPPIAGPPPPAALAGPPPAALEGPPPPAALAGPPPAALEGPPPPAALEGPPIAGALQGPQLLAELPPTEKSDLSNLFITSTTGIKVPIYYHVKHEPIVESYLSNYNKTVDDASELQQRKEQENYERIKKDNYELLNEIAHKLVVKKGAIKPDDAIKLLKQKGQITEGTPKQWAKMLPEDVKKDLLGILNKINVEERADIHRAKSASQPKYPDGKTVRRSLLKLASLYNSNIDGRSSISSIVGVIESNGISLEHLKGVSKANFVDGIDKIYKEKTTTPPTTPLKKSTDTLEKEMTKGAESTEKQQQYIKDYLDNPPEDSPQTSASFTSFQLPSPLVKTLPETPSNSPPPTPPTPLPAEINDYNASNPQSIRTNIDANANSKASLVQRRLELQEKSGSLSGMEKEELEKISSGEQYLRNQQTVHKPSQSQTPPSFSGPTKEELDKAKRIEEMDKAKRIEELETDILSLKSGIKTREEVIKLIPNDNTSKERLEQYKVKLEQAEKELNSLRGSGKKEGGLYDDQIESVMDDYKQKGFKGVYAIDEIDKIPVSNKMGVILNLDKSNQRGSHWISLFIDVDGDKSVEYYDSYGEDPPEEFMKGIKQIVDKLNPDFYLKFKVNKIKQQAENSDTCGFHAMRFLINRLNGIPFKFCTGYSDVVNSEKKAKKFKNELEKFGFI